MANTGARKASIILGVIMAGALLAGSILPLFGNNAPQQQLITPTPALVPTFPPPVTNFDAIDFSRSFLHPSGLFTIAQPTGFQPTEPNIGLTLAQVNMVNEGTLSVIDAYIEDAGGPISADDLDARFDRATLAATWARFTNWNELSRRRDGDALLIDFAVTLQRQTYVARQRTWTDGRWIYVVRVLTPDNATNYLVFVLNNVSASLRPFHEFAGTPFNWQAHYDPAASHIIRFPGDWTVADSAPGRPTSIIGTDGEALRLEYEPGVAVSDETAASAWAQAQRAGVQVTSVRPIAQGDQQGFSVAYTLTTADGEPQSGFAVLLNADDGLHSANLRFPDEGIDLNTIDVEALLDVIALEAQPPAVPEATAEATPETEAANEDEEPAPFDPNLAYYNQLALMMSTFRVLPPLNLAGVELPQATPFALPTAQPGEATAEAEATPEAPALEPEVEATAEATEPAS